MCAPDYCCNLLFTVVLLILLAFIHFSYQHLPLCHVFCMKEKDIKFNGIYAMMSFLHMHWWFSFIVFGFCLTLCLEYISEWCFWYICILTNLHCIWVILQKVCYSDSVLSYCLYISHLFWQAQVMSSRHSKGNYTILYSLLSSYHLPTSARWLWFCSILNDLTGGGFTNIHHHATRVNPVLWNMLPDSATKANYILFKWDLKTHLFHTPFKWLLLIDLDFGL